MVISAKIPEEFAKFKKQAGLTRRFSGFDNRSVTMSSRSSIQYQESPLVRLGNELSLQAHFQSTFRKNEKIEVDEELIQRRRKSCECICCGSGKGKLQNFRGLHFKGTETEKPIKPESKLNFDSMSSSNDEDSISQVSVEKAKTFLYSIFIFTYRNYIKSV